MVDYYGNRTWRRGDDDNLYVKRLQRDLAAAGFAIVGRADGDYGRRTFWAVREFQSYAAGEVVATVDSGPGPVSERLSAQDNTGQIYGGPISGVADEATQERLRHWVENDWHCPVVVDACRIDGQGRRGALVRENVWYYTSAIPGTRTVGHFAKDVTGRYADIEDADGWVRLGPHIKWSRYRGVQSLPPKFTQPDAEIFPKSLTGDDWADLNDAQRSSFRVIRAVSEVECIGFFDCLNTYDNAFVSIGPCHWTLGIISNSSSGVQVSKGELCGTLAYFEETQSDAAAKFLGASGVTTSGPWLDADGEPTGKLLYNRRSAKYASWLAFEQEDESFETVPFVEAEGDYFKTWHWIYRWVAELRTSTGLRQAIWDMARVRLRDLLVQPITVGAETSTIGQVFTSELATALLMRWHVRYPAYVVSGGAGIDVRRALEIARGTSVPGGWNQPVANWGDRHERALVRALRRRAEVRSDGFQTTLDQVLRWPAWASGPNPRRFQLADGLTKLSDKRGSFELHGAGLPPPPY